MTQICYKCHLEVLLDDGVCDDVIIKANVNQMWQGNELVVDFTITGWDPKFWHDRLLPVDRLGDHRQARLINDWSRLRFNMEYYNHKLHKNIAMSRPKSLQNDQWISQVASTNGQWRILFIDNKSRELSDMGEQRGRLEFKLKFVIDKEIDSKDFEYGFDLDVSNTNLCDGGYLTEFVEDKKPSKVPSECDVVPDHYLKDKYQKPVNGRNIAELFVQAKPNQVMGCRSYVVIGFDAPRTSIQVDSSNSRRTILSAIPLTKNIKPCKNCDKGSAYWKLVLTDEIKTQSNANLHINMAYFGTEEQAPVPFFQYNCNFNIKTCDDNENSQDSQLPQDRYSKTNTFLNMKKLDCQSYFYFSVLNILIVFKYLTAIEVRAVISQRKTIVKSKDSTRYIRFLLANKRAMRDLSISQSSCAG